MKRTILSVLSLAVITTTMSASDLPYWQDPNVIEVNRYPMTATFDTQGNKISLNGVWDFKWYETPDLRATDFFKSDFV